MKSIYVPLPEEAADLLRELARREMRDPREQAAWLILAGLKAAGLHADLASRERAIVETKGSRR